MQDAQIIARIQSKYRSLEPEMDERLRRQWAAAEARDMGWGGITAVAQATGMSRTTLTAGLRELALPEEELSFITKNWRARPLVNLEVMVNLIAGTTTRTGLIVKAALDTNPYPAKIKVTDEQLGRLRLKRHAFHGEWNYTLSPRKRK